MSTQFGEEHYQEAYPDGIENNYWHLFRNRVIVDELRKLGMIDLPVLDVGCGRGITLKYLREQGIDCTGVEKSITRPLVGTEDYIHFGLEAVELESEEQSRYRMILLLDVIEHLPDPESFLKSTVRPFRNVSHVIITVPSGPELWSNYDEFYGHFRRYSMEMIHQLAIKLGWDLIRSTYFFRFLYPPSRAMAALGKKRSTRITAPKSFSKITQRALSYLFLFERLLPSSFPGTSIIATFRLPPR